MIRRNPDALGDERAHVPAARIAVASVDRPKRGGIDAAPSDDEVVRQHDAEERREYGADQEQEILILAHRDEERDQRAQRAERVRSIGTLARAQNVPVDTAAE